MRRAQVEKVDGRHVFVDGHWLTCIGNRLVRPGDRVQIHGPTTGVQEFTVGELHRDDERPAIGEKGTWVTFAAPRCRVGDKVFFLEDTPFAQKTPPPA